MTSRLATTSRPALGSTATLVVTQPATQAAAARILDEHLEAIDQAASRFRADSELSELNRRAGTGPVVVSALLLDVVESGLRAAQVSGGLVDPTVGVALELIGYDRDFLQVAPDGPPLTFAPRSVAGWRSVTVDRGRSTVTVPPGVKLDFGATAKAMCADRSAAAIARATGHGVLVSLGGDMAVAGLPPDQGWTVRIGDDHREPVEAPGPVVTIRSGGLATSSTLVRAWRRGGAEVHHLIDPATSRPAQTHWRTVTVAAASCLDANVGSCAALLMGLPAAAWLADQGLPARLVDRLGEVTRVGGWPDHVDGPSKVAACS